MDKMLEMNRFDRISTESYKQQRARLGLRASPMYKSAHRKIRAQRKRAAAEEDPPKEDEGSVEADAVGSKEDEDDLYDTKKYNDDEDVSFSNPNDNMDNDDDASISKMSHSTSPKTHQAAIPSQIQISEKKGSRKCSHASLPKVSSTKPKSSIHKTLAASTSSSIHKPLWHITNPPPKASLL